MTDDEEKALQAIKKQPKSMTPLAAIRAAAAVPLGGTHDRPEVMVYVMLRDEDPIKFVATRQTLEQQQREGRVKRMKSKEELVEETKEAAKKDDGYNRETDEVTPRLEKHIEAWLKKTLERVNALPPAPSGSASTERR